MQPNSQNPSIWRRIIDWVLFVCCIIGGISLGSDYLSRETPYGQDFEARYNGLIYEGVTNSLENGIPIGQVAQFEPETIATWSIRQGHLWLVGLTTWADLLATNKEVITPLTLPGKTLPLLATWYTGQLRIGLGEPIGLISEEQRAFVNYQIIYVSKGEVTGSSTARRNLIQKYSTIVFMIGTLIYWIAVHWPRHSKQLK